MSQSQLKKKKPEQYITIDGQHYTPQGIPLSNGAVYLLDHPSEIRGGWPLIKESVRGAPVPFPVISHGVGQIPFAPPKAMQRVMRASIDKWAPSTYMIPPQGHPALREALATEMCDLAGSSNLVSSDEIMVVTGGTIGAIRNLLGLCLNAGDTWSESVPAWMGTRHETNFWERRHHNFFLPSGHFTSLEDLQDMVPAEAKVVSLNDPGNPTGQSLTLHDCEVIREFARARPNTLIVVDTTYLRLNAIEFISPFMWGEPNIVLISSASKGINVANARIGFIMWSRKSGLTAAMLARANQELSPPNTADIQLAIAEALNDKNEDGVAAYCRGIVKHVEAGRDDVEGYLKNHPLVRYRRGTSAIYDELETVDETVDVRRLWRWGVHKRYLGKITRPFVDMVASFYMQGRRARFTHAQLKSLPGIINWTLDLEEYTEEGEEAKDPSMEELVEMHGFRPALLESAEERDGVEHSDRIAAENGFGNVPVGQA